MNRRVRFTARLGRGFNWHFPARENQHRWMAPECTRKHLRALNANSNTIVFYGGQRRLRNPAQFGKLILAQTLKLAKHAHRFADRNFDAFPGRAILLHLGSPIIMRGDRHDLKCGFIGDDAANHAERHAQARRSMPLRCASKRFVVEPDDPAQSERPRHCRDVLPLLVSLQDLLRHRCALSVDAPVLKNLPHAILYIYHIWHVKPSPPSGGRGSGLAEELSGQAEVARTKIGKHAAAASNVRRFNLDSDGGWRVVMTPNVSHRPPDKEAAVLRRQTG